MAEQNDFVAKHDMYQTFENELGPYLKKLLDEQKIVGHGIAPFFVITLYLKKEGHEEIIEDIRKRMEQHHIDLEISTRFVDRVMIVEE